VSEQIGYDELGEVFGLICRVGSGMVESWNNGIMTVSFRLASPPFHYSSIPAGPWF